MTKIAALVFAVVSLASVSAVAAESVKSAPVGKCATAKRTVVSEDGTIRIQTRTVCVKG